ncbi:MAG: TonB family protein [Parafilimonas sp.]
MADTHFEQQKNFKALGITALIIAAVFFAFFLISWTLPQLPLQTLDEGVEVNLGNSDQGFGNIPPLIPGEPSLAQRTNYNPPPSTQSSAETQKEVAENNEADATPINTSPKPEIKKPNMPINNITKTKTQTETNSPPTPPKAKAVYAGGKSTGTGGNNSDSYNNSRNQGIAGGTGDQGKPNGNPNSDNYTGNGGKGTSGVSITDGLTGRRLAGTTHFEDEYRYGGKVLVNVTVDENGTVTSAKVKLGSAFSDINSIAVRRAYQLKFTKGSEVQTGTVTIIFQNPKG